MHTKLNIKKLAFTMLFCLVTTQANGEASDYTVRGVVEAQNTAKISSPYSAKITKLPFRRGDIFNKGDLLIGFDCREAYANLSVTKAELAESKADFDSLKIMANLNAGSDVEMKMAEAKMAAAKARKALRNTQASYCKIRAPYTGKVVSNNINLHETPAPGTELMTILDYRNLEVELIMPSQWISTIKPGSHLDFNIDETKTHHELEVINLGAEIDPVSHTIRVRARSRSGWDSSILPGMTGVASFRPETIISDDQIAEDQIIVDQESSAYFHEH